VSRITEALERAKNGAASPAETPRAADEGRPAAEEIRPAAETQAAWNLGPGERQLDRGTVDNGPETGGGGIGDRLKEEYKDKVIVGANVDRALVEQYRQLAALLHRVQARDNVHTVMIASAVAGEGKTLTASNLALTLSQSYQRRVLLIDADLRSPSIHRVFQLPNTNGLGTVVKAARGGALPIHWLSPTLAVLTGGQPDSDPMSSLVSRAIKTLLTEASEQFDWVVVDTPPVALMSDAKLLGSMVDATLFVVSANSTPYPLVKRATEALGTSVLGVVLNRVAKAEVAGGSAHYGYGYAYDYGRGRSKER
jgi:capsular exopolysaccharide synthesis family protein